MRELTEGEKDKVLELIGEGRVIEATKWLKTQGFSLNEAKIHVDYYKHIDQFKNL